LTGHVRARDRRVTRRHYRRGAGRHWAGCHRCRRRAWPSGRSVLLRSRHHLGRRLSNVRIRAVRGRVLRGGRLRILRVLRICGRRLRVLCASRRAVGGSSRLISRVWAICGLGRRRCRSRLGRNRAKRSVLRGGLMHAHARHDDRRGGHTNPWQMNFHPKSPCLKATRPPRLAPGRQAEPVARESFTGRCRPRDAWSASVVGEAIPLRTLRSAPSEPVPVIASTCRRSQSAESVHNEARIRAGERCNRKVQNCLRHLPHRNSRKSLRTRKTHFDVDTPRIRRHLEPVIKFAASINPECDRSSDSTMTWLGTTNLNSISRLAARPGSRPRIRGRDIFSPDDIGGRLPRCKSDLQLVPRRQCGARWCSHERVAKCQSRVVCELPAKTCGISFSDSELQEAVTMARSLNADRQGKKKTAASRKKLIQQPPAGAPFNEQDPKRRLGNFSGAGEHPRKGGRTSGIVGQRTSRSHTDKRS
jgi:hypothetical protein